jgi:hypothetical protein
MQEHPPHEEAAHASHGASAENRRLALLIAILALFLAISETLGKAAQTQAVARNVEASNLWAFFQAKTVRQTVLRIAVEEGRLRAPGLEGPARDALDGQLAQWTATIDRWESEPATGEGRKELTARARRAEDLRDRSMAAYHAYEYGSAAFQVAIVVASASIITGVPALAVGALALGIAGLALTGVGSFAPQLMGHHEAPHQAEH